MYNRRNNNIYYLNNQKVRSSCPISFQTTSLKAQYQLRAGVFSFPKKSPAFNNNNNQKKNEFNQCTSRIKQIQKDVKIKDKTSLKNKRRAFPLREIENRKDPSSSQYSKDIPSKTRTEANIENSVFTESSCKPCRTNHANKRRETTKQKQYSSSKQYYSDYSYSTYTYTNRENSSQNENSRNSYDSNKENNNFQQSITLSDHLSSETIERKVASIKSDIDEDHSNDIGSNDGSDIKISNHSDSVAVHQKSRDMHLSDMDSITATADVVDTENTSQKRQSSKHTQNSSSHKRSEKTDSLKQQKKDKKEEKLSSSEINTNKELDNGNSDETVDESNTVFPEDNSQKKDQINSEAEKVLSNNEEIDNNDDDTIQLIEYSENENIENSQNYEQSYEDVKNRSVEINESEANNDEEINVYDNQNNNDSEEVNNNEYSNDNTENEVVEENTPAFKALLEANQKLVSAVLKNQEALLNIVENEYTKKALEHLHEAVTLLESVEPK